MLRVDRLVSQLLRALGDSPSSSQRPGLGQEGSDLFSLLSPSGGNGLDSFTSGFPGLSQGASDPTMGILDFLTPGNTGANRSESGFTGPPQDALSMLMPLLEMLANAPQQTQEDKETSPGAAEEGGRLPAEETTAAETAETNETAETVTEEPQAAQAQATPAAQAAPAAPPPTQAPVPPVVGATPGVNPASPLAVSDQEWQQILANPASATTIMQNRLIALGGANPIQAVNTLLGRPVIEVGDEDDKPDRWKGAKNLLNNIAQQRANELIAAANQHNQQLRLQQGQQPVAQPVANAAPPNPPPAPPRRGPAILFTP